jgi:hypothetical protein
MEEDLDTPQSIKEALDEIVKLERGESICSQFHRLLRVIDFFAKSQPQNTTLCVTIKEGMLRQHYAYHVLLEGIVNERLAQGESNAAHIKEGTG